MSDYDCGAVFSYQACQFNCKTPFCPHDHPFALNEGKSCCKWFTCKTNGLRLTENDALDCCHDGDHIPCDEAYGCVDHPQAEEYCPANENLKRMGGEFGYIGDAVTAKPYDKAIQFCSSNGVNWNELLFLNIFLT